MEQLTAAGVVGAWEGRRLSEPETGRCFLVLDGVLRPVSDAEMYLKLFCSPPEVLPDPIPSGLPLGPPLAADAELLQLADGRVFLVAGGERRHVRDPVAMDVYGFAWGQVIGVPDDIILAIPLGPPIPADAWAGWVARMG